MEKFEKVYKLTGTYESKFQTFCKNLELVERHNAEYYAGLTSFTLEMNYFGDWTNEEYKGYLKRSGDKSEDAFNMIAFKNDGSDLPESVDWRTKNIVNDPKNQGSCGSCWAFSTIAAVESAHAQKTGKLVSLSEQQLVDCVDGGEDDCSHGGLMEHGFEDIISRGGVMTEEDYPYLGTSGHKCAFNKTSAVATVNSYMAVKAQDEEDLKAAAAQGVVSVAIDASSIWFQLYFGGVYDHSWCSSTSLDHGVAVVGYGHDEAKNKDFWIVRNSW